MISTSTSRFPLATRAFHVMARVLSQRSGCSYRLCGHQQLRQHRRLCRSLLDWCAAADCCRLVFRCTIMTLSGVYDTRQLTTGKCVVMIHAHTSNGDAGSQGRSLMIQKTATAVRCWYWGSSRPRQPSWCSCSWSLAGWGPQAGGREAQQETVTRQLTAAAEMCTGSRCCH